MIYNYFKYLITALLLTSIYACRESKPTELKEPNKLCNLFKNLQMQNTNHMHERNSLETRDRLNELFLGIHGRQFKLDQR